MDEVLGWVVECQGSCGVSFSDVEETCPECEGAADTVIAVTGNNLYTMSYDTIVKVRNICATIEELHQVDWTP